MTQNYGGHEKRRLLYVEDEEDLRRVVSETLEEDFDLVAVNNVRSALELIHSDSVHFDVLITDFNLRDPNGTGHEVARAMRLRYPDAPIVLMTGNSPEDPNIRDVLRIPRTFLVQKPRLSRVVILEAVASAEAAAMPKTLTESAG